MNKTALTAVLGLVLVLSACSAPRSDSSSGDSGASSVTADTPQLPNGYHDAGTGLAYEFMDSSEVKCPAYDDGCVGVDLYAYEDCPNLVYVEANELDSSDAVIGYTNGTLAQLTRGQYGKLYLGSMDDGVETYKLTKIQCE